MIELTYRPATAISLNAMPGAIVSAMNHLGIAQFNTAESGMSFVCGDVLGQSLTAQRTFDLSWELLAEHGVVLLSSRNVARGSVGLLSVPQRDRLVSIANLVLLFCKARDNGQGVELRYQFTLPAAGVADPGLAMSSLLCHAVIALDAACQEFENLAQQAS